MRVLKDVTDVFGEVVSLPESSVTFSLLAFSCRCRAERLEQITAWCVTQGHFDTMFGCCRLKRCVTCCYSFIKMQHWQNICHRQSLETDNPDFLQQGFTMLALGQGLSAAISSEAIVVTQWNRCINLIVACDWCGLQAFKSTAVHK